jgi:hypothetical protein
MFKGTKSFQAAAASNTVVIWGSLLTSKLSNKQRLSSSQGLCIRNHSFRWDYEPDYFVQYLIYALVKWPLKIQWNFCSSGFEVLTAVAVMTSIFWDITLCNPLKVNQRFVETYRLHLPGGIIISVPLST